ncbi:MAG TPA: HEAT repeat domain-containing protein [Methanomicrobiales archaeon]|nr:HEAT repeat domain-containing protein [Methanomicrobiales archaeon]
MMPSFLARFFGPARPDIGALAKERDIPGLIAALRHPDLEVQWRAAAALGSLGPEAIDQLLGRLPSRNRAVKLGIIEALGEIADPRAVDPLIRNLRDPSVEVRWETALALGEIGDERAVGPLLPGLRDPDRYIRYGTALALPKLGWKAETPGDQASLLLGLQDWDGLRRLGPAAIPALSSALADREKTVRARAVEVLGEIGDRAAIPAIIRALRDRDDEVRWKAVLAGPRCGIAPLYLPRGLAGRPRARKNPAIAAFLNLILPGQGYLYLGRWWGILIFQVDITVTLWLFATMGDQPTYGLLLPIYVIIAAHAWYLAGKMPEM